MDATAPPIRPLTDADSLEALTDLLHRAYGSLAAAGMHYVASHQSVETTRERIARGTCFVGTWQGELVATATLVPPGGDSGPAYYHGKGVAKVEQFCVHPDWQGIGLGSRVMRHLEACARDLGARELALDTSENATGLIDWYARRGYERVGACDWRPRVNYRSVILSRFL